jgi:hypothetical protein
MKYTKYAVAVAALMIGGLTKVKAQTADEIIQKYITAIGGAENWNKVKSLKLVGSANAGGMEIPVEVTMVDDKAMRLDMTINGMKNYQIYTTTEGWMYFPIQGQQKPEAMPAEAVKDMANELDLQDPLMSYKTTGIKVAYLGKDDVEGTECYKLKVTYKTGKEETMFFDAANYYHIKSVTKAKVNGQEKEQASTYSNFQKLPEGIVFPMSQDQGGGLMNVKTVQVNPTVDEKIFKPTN